MKNENYITVLGWMVNQLHLSGNELLVYALIYGFSQDGSSAFDGTCSYISESLSISRRATVDVLKRLTDKGHIIKDEKIINNIVVKSYRINKDSTLLMSVTSHPYEESSQGGMKNLHTDNTSIDNNPPRGYYYNKYNNISLVPPKGGEKEMGVENEPVTQGQKKFIRPTVEQVREYCNERKNNINPESFVDFYDSKGWKVGNSPMKDWKAAVRTWENKRKQEIPQQAQEPVDDLQPIIKRISEGFFDLNYNLDYCKQLLVQDGDDNPFRIGFYRKHPSILVKLTEWANKQYECTGKEKWLAYLKIVKDMLLG